MGVYAQLAKPITVVPLHGARAPAFRESSAAFILRHGPPVPVDECFGYALLPAFV